MVHLFLFSSALFFFNGCKEKEAEPCADCNLFTCVVNGEKFSPHADGWKVSTLNAATYGDKELIINAHDYEKYIGIDIRLPDSLKVGTYRLATFPPATGLYGDGTSNYTTNSTNTGEFVITRLVYGNRPVMEGTFAFQCVGINVSNQQRVTITDGKFRLFFGRGL